MIIKAKSYFATAFFMDIREIAGSSPTMTEREESHPRACPGGLKTQGTASRYAHRKQRASAKVLAAAGVAVKLATACALQQRFVPQPVMWSSWLQLGKQNIRRLKNI